MIIAIESVAIALLVIWIAMMSERLRQAEENSGVFERASMYWMRRALQHEEVIGYVDPSHGGATEAELITPPPPQEKGGEA